MDGDQPVLQVKDFLTILTRNAIRKIEIGISATQNNWSETKS